MVKRIGSKRIATQKKTRSAPKTGHKDWLGRPITAAQCKRGHCSVHPK